MIIIKILAVIILLIIVVLLIILGLSYLWMIYQVNKIKKNIKDNLKDGVIELINEIKTNKTK